MLILKTRLLKKIELWRLWIVKTKLKEFYFSSEILWGTNQNKINPFDAQGF